MSCPVGFVAEGLRWRIQETWFIEKATVETDEANDTLPLDPEFAQKRVIEKLYTDPPRNSVVMCLDQIGPLSVRSYLGL